jgi:hypothetical protein
VSNVLKNAVKAGISDVTIKTLALGIADIPELNHTLLYPLISYMTSVGSPLI